MRSPMHKTRGSRLRRGPRRLLVPGNPLAMLPELSMQASRLTSPVLSSIGARAYARGHDRVTHPQHRMELGIAGGVAAPDDLATGVHRVSRAEAAAEGAEIDHPAARRPRERTDLDIAGGYAVPD